MTHGSALERREEDRERLEAAVRDLMTSEGWQRWAETRSRFHAYSLNNTLLIAAQHPDATRVAGYKTWQQLGHQVMKGERGIRIFAPIGGPCKACAGKGGKVFPEGFLQCGRCMGQGRWQSFKIVSVFDVSQTEGDPLPESSVAPIEGDSHKAHLAELEDFASSLGYSVTYDAIGGGAKGYCDLKGHRIVVESSMSPNRQIKVLIHEIAHALGVDYDGYGREGAEVIVEAATYIVCGAIGLDTSTESLPYIAGWGEAEDLQSLKKHAATVDEIAGKLEAVLGLGRKTQPHAA